MLTLVTDRKLPRGTIAAALTLEVAQPTGPALGEGDALAILGEVKEQIARVQIINAGANRHAQCDICTRGTKLIASAPVLAVGCTMDAGIAKVHQGIDVSVCDSVDVATTAAIATIWAPFGDKTLAAKAGDAVSAVASNDFNRGFINKFHGVILQPKGK